MHCVHPASTLSGTIVVPADKSISHRYAILGAMATGRTRILNFSPSEDCRSTLSCLAQLGVSISQDRGEVIIESPGWERLKQPEGTLDA
ncbi:MAG TPA: 3-phosphoshikimate 1-carboxyvinyltransferase, partial [Acidobacteriota bacterium]|nr:3-phosphoshikimate 1-carboxyvinyltransferase [Acidobacteriota bacterium]